MNTHILKAEKRTQLGRKVRKLRQGGFIPANIFGKSTKSQAITVALKEFEKVFSEAGETGIVEILLEKEKRTTLINNYQKDPVEGNFLHVDFLQVDLKQKITAKVPLELEGESPAEKQGLGTIVSYTDEIEVESLPTDIPEKFTVNVDSLAEVDQQILISDLKYDKSKVEIKDAQDKILVRVEPLRKEEEEAKPISVEGETSSAGEGGEAPTEAKTDDEPQKEEST